MEENKIAPKLFDLVSNKRFELLNEEEKKSVLAEMAEEEYKAMYELHHNMNDLLKEDMLSPANSVKDKLLSSFHQKYSSPKQKQESGSFLLLKIPLYQAAAAVLFAVVLSGAFFYLGKSLGSSQPEIVYKLKRDTVFVKADAKTVVREITADSLAVNESAAEHPSKPGNNGQRKTGSEKLCRSIKQDTGLKQFMVASLSKEI